VSVVAIPHPNGTIKQFARGPGAQPRVLPQPVGPISKMLDFVQAGGCESIFAIAIALPGQALVGCSSHGEHFLAPPGHHLGNREND